MPTSGTVASSGKLSAGPPVGGKVASSAEIKSIAVARDSKGVDLTGGAAKARTATRLAAAMKSVSTADMVAAISSEDGPKEALAGMINPDNAGKVYNVVNPYTHVKSAVVAGSPEAETMARSMAASALVATWASTSNNQHPVSLAMQESAKQVFGTAGAAKWAMNPQLGKEVNANLAAHGHVYQSFLKAQYSQTQADFKAAGITHVALYRGEMTNQGTSIATHQKITAGGNCKD